MSHDPYRFGRSETVSCDFILGEFVGSQIVYPLSNGAFPMDEVLARLEACEWTYGDRDPVALAELSRRIAAIGRTSQDFLKYSELVDGVTFRLSNVANGAPFEIREWNSLDRAIIGSFLGRIVLDSYRRGRFFASALVIGVESNSPGEGFWTLASQVGLLNSNNTDARDRLWFRQVDLARAWHRANPHLEYA